MAEMAESGNEEEENRLSVAELKEDLRIFNDPKLIQVAQELFLFPY